MLKQGSKSLKSIGISRETENNQGTVNGCTGLYVLPKWPFLYSNLATQYSTNNGAVFSKTHILGILTPSQTSARKLVKYIFYDVKLSGKKSLKHNAGNHRSSIKQRVHSFGNQLNTKDNGDSLNIVGLRHNQPLKRQGLKRKLETMSADIEKSKTKRKCETLCCVSRETSSVVTSKELGGTELSQSKFLQVFGPYIDINLASREENSGQSIEENKPSRKLSFMQAFGGLLSDQGQTVKEFPTDGKRNNSANLQITRHLRKAINVCHKILHNTKKNKIHHLLHNYCPLTKAKVNVVNIGNMQIASEQSHVQYSQVYLFLRAVISHTFPCELVWGSKKNMDAFLHGLKRFLYSRRFDKMTVEDLTCKMEISELGWLKGPNARESFYKFIKWLMHEFIFVVLKRLFYVTEHANYRNRLFYFRGEVWAKLSKMEIISLIEKGMWSQIESSSRFQARFSVRFIPKSSGLRPIMKCANTNRNSQNRIPSNDILKIFKFICNKYPRIIGCATQGRNDIHVRWKVFWKICEHKLKLMQLEQIPLFYVKVDISRCFDTIPVEGLLQIIRDVLDRCANLNIASITKGYKYVSECSNAIYSSLKYSLRNVVLHTGGQEFTKLKGIPQGWCLSSMLCDIFYGDLETHCLHDFMNDCSSNDLNCSQNLKLHTLMRFMDDFLFVSTSEEEAMQFLRKMYFGFKEYGCEINSKKTCTNFLVPQNCLQMKNGDKIAVLDTCDDFPWFGLRLPTTVVPVLSCPIAHKTLLVKLRGNHNKCGVALDLSRYSELESIRDCISVNLAAPYHKTSLTLGRSMRLRVYAICFDIKVNSHIRIVRNLYEIACLAALQWLAHDLSHRPEKRAKYSSEIVLSIQRLAAVFVLTAIRKKLPGQKFPNRSVTVWVFFKAFLKKMLQYHSVYKHTCKRFQQAIQRHEKKLTTAKNWKYMKKILYAAVACNPKSLCHLSVRI
ncbi:telomerase reverse transcriptase-like [Clavelina lepadiformis]|uniref:telomerase reverse transcriptase-like n=1 Tax=Clavelina lepadiformis TaxID=159417 RepID=UPI004043100F